MPIDTVRADEMTVSVDLNERFIILIEKIELQTCKWL